MHLGVRANGTAFAVLVWGGVVLVIGTLAAVYPAAHTVYHIYAFAAQSWWSGHNLYLDPDYPYRYSPSFALAFTPFAVLPPGLGNPLWKVLNILCLAVGLRAWCRKVLPVPLSPDQRGALFLCALPTALVSMYNGQANLVCLGLCLVGLAGAAGQRWNRAAACLAAATLIKGYPLALALLLAALYARRFTPRFVAALGLGLLLPFVSQRPNVVIAQYHNWFQRLSQDSDYERYRSFDHLLRVCHCPLSPAAFTMLGLVAGGVVLAWCLVHARQAPGPRERLTHLYLLFAAWVVLFGPATECCTYVMLAPALAWQLVDAFRRSGGRATRLLLGASLILTGFLSTDVFGSSARIFAVEHGSQPIGALLFVAVLVGQGRPWDWVLSNVVSVEMVKN